MDLAAFYGSYRQDGWGRAAFEPSMMVALLLYAYARGERSSRGIERRCVEDVAYRVIAAQQTPDHATIARFRVRHEAELAVVASSPCMALISALTSAMTVFARRPAVLASVVSFCPCALNCSSALAASFI